MKTLALALTLATITGAALAPLPAEASGALSIQLNPRNADEARALRLGLALYAVHRDLRGNGHVTQNGVNNAAAIVQRGRGTTAIIHQEGRGHDGSITQEGGNQAHGLFQFGRNTSGHVVQSGRGQTGVTILYGW